MSPPNDEHASDVRIDGLTTVLRMFLQLVATDAVASGAEDESVLTDLLRVVTAGVVGAEAVSITQVRSGKPVTVASTGMLALAVDSLQYSSGQGPCLLAIRDQTLVTTGDVRGDERWPLLVQCLPGDSPVRSMCSMPLSDVGMARASLNIYSERVEVWPGPGGAVHDVATGGVTTATLEATRLALVALNRGRRVAHLERALDSNRAIGAAIGILMVTQELSDEHAFAALMRASQNRNVKLHVVAGEVVTTGRLVAAGE